jgi:hypothetical protein
MHRPQQAAAVILLLFAAFIVWQALKLQYYTPLGPGAGFFAVWLGGLLSLLALVQLLQSARTARKPAAINPAVSGSPESEEEQAMPTGRALLRVGAVLGALILTGLLLPVLGFQVTVFVLLVFLLLGLERVRPLTTLIVAVVFSVGLFQILTRYLDVELPLASLSFLKQLGL